MFVFNFFKLLLHFNTINIIIKYKLHKIEDKPGINYQEVVWKEK